MFGLGIIETGIVLALAYVAFRRFVVRRYPGIYRAIDVALAATAVLMVLFGLLTQSKG